MKAPSLRTVANILFVLPKVLSNSNVLIEDDLYSEAFYHLSEEGKSCVSKQYAVVLGIVFDIYLHSILQMFIEERPSLALLANDSGSMS